MPATEVELPSMMLQSAEEYSCSEAVVTANKTSNEPLQVQLRTITWDLF